jgi:DNA-binding CsgD family transcriptional regulator
VKKDLSKREFEVLRLLAEGKVNRQVAEQLGISVRTVEGHRARIMLKLELASLS